MLCIVCRNLGFRHLVHWLQIVWCYTRKCKWLHFVSVLSLDFAIGWVFLVLIKGLFFRAVEFSFSWWMISPHLPPKGRELSRSRLKEILIKLTDRIKSAKTVFWVSCQWISLYNVSFKMSLNFITKGSITKQCMFTVSGCACQDIRIWK